jgi:protein-S-isoprenylcysteine O-methyltransferase Ste14
MRPVFAADLISIAFFAVDARLRKGDAARSFLTGAADRGTSAALGLSHFAALVLPWLVSTPGSAPWGWWGVALLLAGLGLHTWALRHLGAFYTRTLQIQDGQRVVTSGPYRFVRHPGYAGQIAGWIGVAVASESAIAIAATATLTLAVYGFRMHIEEGMLLAHFGDEYRAYRRRTLL